MADAIVTYQHLAHAPGREAVLALPDSPGLVTSAWRIARMRRGYRRRLRSLSYVDFCVEWYEYFIGRSPNAPPHAERNALNFSLLPAVTPHVEHGRWIWQCGACNAAAIVSDNPDDPTICSYCGTGGWHRVTFPTDRAEIEAELLKQPGYRHRSPVRDWKLGWNLEHLRARTARAKALQASGVQFIRALSIGSTHTWTTGEILSATNLNTHVNGPIDDIAGRNGTTEFEDSIQIESGSDGSRFLQLPSGTTAQRPSSPSDGMIRLNTTTDTIDFRADGEWKSALTESVITFENLNSNGDVGTGAAQVAAGNHTHAVATENVMSASVAWGSVSSTLRYFGTTAAGTTEGATTYDLSPPTRGRIYLYAFVVFTSTTLNRNIEVRFEILDEDGNFEGFTTLTINALGGAKSAATSFEIDDTDDRQFRFAVRRTGGSLNITTLGLRADFAHL